MSLDEKRSCIERTAPQLSIKKQCKLINLNRSSLFYQAKESIADKDLPIKNLMDELYTRHPFYGSRQLRNALRDLKEHYPSLPLRRINRKKIQRLIREMGLVLKQQYWSLMDPYALSMQNWHKDGEERWQTLGLINGVIILLVAHTFHVRDDIEVIGIISARKATRQERKYYEQNK